MDEVIRKIIDAGPVELFYLFLGALLLYAVQKAYSWIRCRITKKRIEDGLVKYQRRKDIINVIDLANGVPEIIKEDVIFNEASNFGTRKCLFIDMAASHKRQLEEFEKTHRLSADQRIRFNQDQSLDGSCNFDDLVEMTGIPNLKELIEEHRNRVGEKVLAKKGMFFNENKYGVYDLRLTRFGREERLGVEVDVFTTDYFTHQVFRSIYQDLVKIRNHNHFVTIDNYLNYRPFLTSLGINALLICEGESGKEIVLTKRSGRVQGNTGLYNITMNEGLNLTDKDTFGIIDLEQWIKRGFKEELGIIDLDAQCNFRFSIFDFFLERNRLETGITSVVKVGKSFAKHIEPLIARDKALEIDEFIVLPMNPSVIREFVRKHEFVPHGLYVLERVLMRERLTDASILFDS